MGNVYYIGLLSTFGINILGALGAHVILYSGQISVGNAGFMAIGAYVAGALTTYGELPIFLAVAAGGVTAAAFGALVGLPALRLKGAYLVIGTIGFCEMVQSALHVIPGTGGASGMRGIPRMPVWMIFFFAAVAVVVLTWWERTRSGLSLRVVADDGTAAAALGIRVVRLKILSFTAGALLAGLAGGCYAHWVQYIEPDDFTIMVSTMMVLPAILGGKRRIAGALLGAAVFTALPELLRFADTWRMVAYGVLVIMVVIWRPEGILQAKPWGGDRHVNS